MTIERTVPAGVRREVDREESPEIFLLFLTISHPSLSSPIPVVSDGADFILGGVTFKGFEFSELSYEMEKKGYILTPMILDQGDERSVLELKNKIASLEDSFDILINNAVLRPMRSYNDPSCKFEESMEVNATGLFNITRAFGELMEKQKSGSIINIGSIQQNKYW